MNLSNGWCGPEGCLTLGTTDSGRGGFSIVIFSTMALATLATWAFYHFGHGTSGVRTVFYAAVLLALMLILTLKSLNVYYATATASPW